MPRFINSEWVAQLLRAGFIEPQNGTEKGHSHGPILLPLFDPDLSICSFQSVIDMWHDGLGVCRAAQQVGHILVLCVSRFFPETGVKNLQKTLIEHTVKLPFFLNDDGDVHFHLFEICGLIFHLGDTPHTGNYKAVLLCNHKWLVYDDGQIAQPIDALSDIILTNVVMFWLIPACGTSARHLLDRQRANLRDGPVEDANDISMTPRT